MAGGIRHNGREYPTPEYVRECLDYRDGRLFWKRRPRSHFPCDWSHHTWNVRLAEKEAGCAAYDKSRKRHTVCVTINNRRYKMSQIVWAIHHNEWVPQIDHKDRNRLNNKIENLRPATNSQNHANTAKRRDNKTGYKGVTFDKSRNKFFAQYTFQGTHYNIGRFDSAEDAYEAYQGAVKKLHGEFFCGG